VADKLDTYRGKRSAARTPEPVPATTRKRSKAAKAASFVVQEHDARALHWDFRLERDGVLVSWAVPKGIPTETRQNHLAVHTEDHPLEYASFEGTIPKGEYGGGEVTIWDHGTYECEEWTDREVKVVLHGQRADGRYVLIHTDDKNWLMHRTRDQPGAVAGKAPSKKLPALVRPMLATLGELPPDNHDELFAYETKWDGVRTVAYLDGGRVRLLSRNDLDVTRTYPELADLGGALAVPAIVDGEVVAYDPQGRVSFGALQPRMHLQNAAQVRRLAEETPVTYHIFDLLYLDGNDTVALPYRERRELLEGLDLDGPQWSTSPSQVGGGAAALAKAKELGLEGIMAKRLTSRYEPGRRSKDWVKVKNTATQEVVLGGWRPGKGNRAGTIGSLLLGMPSPEGLRYAGQVGTGFTRAFLADLQRRLDSLARKTSPFADELPSADARGAQWVSPKLVGEVEFTEWTRDGRLRHPAWRGLRLDKSPGEVVPSGEGKFTGA
jgi:bifunctional non-homologous end joining protein LigD